MPLPNLQEGFRSAEEEEYIKKHKNIHLSDFAFVRKNTNKKIMYIILFT